MTVDEKETTNDHGNDLNCSIETKTEAENDDSGALLLDGTSAEGLRIYKRKRRKMTNSDDKIKAADGSVADQDKRMLSFDAFTNGPGECSLRHCSNSILQQMRQSLNGHEDGLGGCIQNTFVTYQESGCMDKTKKSLENVERSDNQTNGSTPELSGVMSCGLLKQSEGSTSSELCWRALSDILNSDKFYELRGLLLKNFGVDNVNRVLGIDAISLKMKNGAYETSPMPYLKDMQQVWTKLQQVCNEMVTLAHSLSDESKQFVRKPWAAEPRICQGCEQKAEVKDCLVCDSCEDIYHLSCTELVGTQIPPINWYCARCVSNGLGSPHDNCVVCEKLKAAAPIPLVNGIPITDQSQDAPNGSERHLHDVTDENQSSNICFVCKLEVKIGDNSRTCSHSLCIHKFYHYKCLTSKQLGVWGPCWYCPSCLCRRCLVDKDDDQIVLCDSCDEAYHIYCVSPQLPAIPKGSWFCVKCDRELKRLRTMRRVYERMQKKVKIEDGSEKVEPEEAMNEREGLDMLVSAAKTLSL
ncbi:hypothetical protein L1987_52288 [Smallanthus sonchifolius]|uniref:Uncharacterized protein n=1 Tax=Smallanthus sonchifolius TaxID=185202 RepID=A0ACB9ET20_9ASTR|nr:hypothetical protein L1987_52288 [Smallanthus sonchifolius]